MIPHLLSSRPQRSFVVFVCVCVNVARPRRQKYKRCLIILGSNLLRSEAREASHHDGLEAGYTETERKRERERAREGGREIGREARDGGRGGVGSRREQEGEGVARAGNRNRLAQSVNHGKDEVVVL